MVAALFHAPADGWQGHIGMTVSCRGGPCASTICIIRHLTFPESAPMQDNSPPTVVQAQLDAFNARDIDALMATYATDAEQFILHGERLAQGHAELRPRYLARFQEPDLYARLLSRTVMGHIVIDLELISRNFPEGRGSLEMLCVYEVVQGRIRRASFASGAMTMLAPSPV